MAITHTKFDLTDPKKWTYEGGVLMYAASSEEGADWEAEMIECIGDHLADTHDSDVDQWMTREEAKLHTDGMGGRFDHWGNCDHCGAWFKFGAMFHNPDTDQHIVVGHQCATNRLAMTASQVVKKNMQNAAKSLDGKIRVKKLEASLAPNRLEALQFDHYISKDLRSNFRKWGRLSLKQWALAKKIPSDQAKYDAEKKRTDELNGGLTPVIEGRIKVTGEVLTTKVQEGYYGTEYKMLVRDDRNFKLWGTIPASIDGVDKGDRVEFMAAVTKSRDDESFGFYKRPTKAVQLQESVA